jgi:hypothetical protein
MFKNILGETPLEQNPSAPFPLAFFPAKSLLSVFLSIKPISHDVEVSGCLPESS